MELAKELCISDCVTFGGRISRREMARALQACMVFVLPSSYEGLGCVYLEAMSTGKVAIGCRGQGIEEVIQHGLNGWLVGADMVEELAAGLSTLIGDKGIRESIGKQARQTILKGFTLRHQAEAFRQIYGECVE
jgi:glycosyltransferase involved in cell wall biosynthesis